MEIIKKDYCNGNALAINVEIKEYRKQLVILFIKSAYSNRNKWNEKDVLTDVEVKRCQLSKIYINSDPTGKNLLDYIDKCKNNYEKVVKEVEKLSDKTDKIYIGLPTSTTLFGEFRKIKDTFRPLLVILNAEDVSVFFQDFDIFGSKAVQVAYDALINGKNPNINNDLFSIYQIGCLHNKICNSAKLNIIDPEK